MIGNSIQKKVPNASTNHAKEEINIEAWLEPLGIKPVTLEARI